MKNKLGLCPHNILKEINDLFPDFDNYWRDNCYLFESPDKTFSIAGILTIYSWYIRNCYNSLNSNDKKIIFDKIEIWLNNDLSLDPVVVSCFLENLMYQDFSLDIKIYLGPESKNYFNSPWI